MAKLMFGDCELISKKESNLTENVVASPHTYLRFAKYVLLGCAFGAACMHTPYLKSLNYISDWQYSIGIIFALWLYLRPIPKGDASLWVCTGFGTLAGPSSFFAAHWAGPLALRWMAKALAVIIPSVPDLSSFRYDLEQWVIFVIVYSIVGTLSAFLAMKTIFRGCTGKRK